MKPYPLIFEPLPKPKVWGGRTLERLLGKTLPPGQMIGESWELADLPASIEGGRSIIANGEMRGLPLHESLQKPQSRKWIMGSADPGDGYCGFPLLIKYLDARQNLSVQVHPSPEYAQRHPDAHLKSEAWVIIDADPGAMIYKGLKPGITRDDFARHIASGEVVNDLLAVDARPGDCHYLPSGTVHALGGGIVVAEVQTPSDTTFRIYDWGRTGSRELHVQQALECIDFSGRASRQQRLAPANTREGITTTPLARTEHFEIERIDAKGGSSFQIVTQNLPQVWMMIAGEGSITGDFTPAVDLRPGTTLLVPAAARKWNARFNAPSRLLCVRLPSPLRNMIA